MHSVCRSPLRQGPVRVSAVFEFVLAGPCPGEEPDRRMERAAHAFGSKGNGAVQRPVEVGKAAPPHIRVATDGVGVRRRNDRCGGPGDAECVQFPAEAFVVADRAFEDRDFDPVITEVAQLSDACHVPVLDEVGQAEKVNAEVHGALSAA
ncbi:hypothetical protein D9M72_553030 [compost metagenome]